MRAVLIFHFVMVTVAMSAWPEPTDAERDLSNRLSVALKEMRNGDFSSLDEAQTKKDLDLLWAVFWNAELGVSLYNEDSDILARTRVLLKKVPGYAEHVGNSIEHASSTHEMNHVRAKAFGMLGAFGGKEAISQLGRFILDERNPTPPWITPMSIGTRPSPNSGWAAQAIDKALGEESPWWPYRKNGQPPSNNANGPRIYEMMKQWWIDTGSKKYGLGLPPAIHPAPELKVEASLKPPEVAAEEARWTWELPALIAFLFLAVLLALLRKRRSP